jgi:hypothetical protein
MPALELTSDMIGQGRSGKVTGRIAATMLWPDDETQRKRAISATDAYFFKEGQQLRFREDRPVVLGYAEFRNITDSLVNAPAMDDMRPEAERRFRQGGLAGRILLDALHDGRLGEQHGLQWVKGEVQSGVRGKSDFPRLSMSTIENRIWPIYRSVAHLWGAYYLSTKAALTPQLLCRVASTVSGAFSRKPKSFARKEKATF